MLIGLIVFGTAEKHEILQVSYQWIVLNICQIWESWNDINLIKSVKMSCCVFNGTQCILTLPYFFSELSDLFFFFYCSFSVFVRLIYIAKCPFTELEFRLYQIKNDILTNNLVFHTHLKVV